MVELKSQNGSVVTNVQGCEIEVMVDMLSKATGKPPEHICLDIFNSLKSVSYPDMSLYL